ncbi:MAG: DUF4416 family protein [Candidatus Omnitrophica bacterium]|nr:DUF4416 family protein [Candidatus Omnitrophota bacterium]
MGSVTTPHPVKLISSVFSNDRALIQETKKRLEGMFGVIDYESKEFIFDDTVYYEREMGEGLVRYFYSFGPLMPPDVLPDVKMKTNALEMEFSVSGKRRVNIDPGFISLGKLVLATTKDHQHRIYLSRGIFAEVTLRFQNNTFTPWEWTYPDYRCPEYITAFNTIRDEYKKSFEHKRTPLAHPHNIA